MWKCPGFFFGVDIVDCFFGDRLAVFSTFGDIMFGDQNTPSLLSSIYISNVLGERPFFAKFGN